MSEENMIGHYRVVQILGTGSMGTVHVAIDTFIDRTVAIKSLRPELTNDPDFVARFRGEAKSLARLNHPNITTLYSTIQNGTDLYMVMEFVKGKSIDEILRERGKPIGVKECLSIIAQVTDGLSYAHDAGVIHRDIKPSNLMISNDGRVKIMDFGIARVRGSNRLTRVGTAVGTPLYMSPEQCKGGEGDERSDLYSLAIVLYEMLSGTPPFNANTEYELIQSQINKVPPALIPNVGGISPTIESVIMKALAKDPQSRYSSVREFSDALGATLLRIDATSVIRNAAHLVDAPQFEDNSQNSTGKLALVQSKATHLGRNISAISTTSKLAATIIAGGLLAGSIFYILNNSSNHKREISIENSLNTQTQTDATIITQNDTPNTNKNEEKAKVKENGDGRENNILTQIQDLRKAINGSPDKKVRARDFEYVSNGVKLQLIEPTMKLAASGEAEAQFILGMLLTETPEHIDFDKALEAFRDAAKQGYSDAEANIAILYQKGALITGKDLNKASYWFKIASEHNNPKGDFWLACYYQFGWGGLDKDKRKAEQLFNKATANQYPQASEALAYLNNKSKGSSPCLK